MIRQQVHWVYCRCDFSVITFSDLGVIMNHFNRYSTAQSLTTDLAILFLYVVSSKCIFVSF